MIILGLTGSIGMGKSTCSAMLQECGVPVHDSDAAVHELLSAGGAAEATVIEAFPSLSKPIDRKALGKIVFADTAQREKLESILHPLVRAAQQKFIEGQKELGADIVALDIPLLYETGAETRVDYVLVASAPPHIQKQRVMERPGMTEDKFNTILARQMPDAEKCKRADFIIDTGGSLDDTMKQVKKIVRDLRKE